MSEPLSLAEEASLIECVRRVAREEIMTRFRRLPPQDIAAKSGPEDLVTVADQRAEQKIAEAIPDLLPGAQVVGEEAVEDDPAVLDRINAGGLCVIIDPVDGTWNFANGLATFGVILSVVRDGTTVFGLLYDPVMDDWVRASLGRGCWYEAPDRQARRLWYPEHAPRPLTDLTAFLPLYLFKPSQRPRLLPELMAFRRMGSLRCSCHEYRTVVQGGLDVLLHASAKPWDHAAGVLAVTEAGGCARFLDGAPYHPGRWTGAFVVAQRKSELETICERFAWLADP